MPGKRSSWARQFFRTVTSDIVDGSTQVPVESERERCIVTDNNGKECGVFFKRNVKNGTSTLINHLKKAHGDNLDVQVAVKESSGKVRNHFKWNFKLNVMICWSDM